MPLHRIASRCRREIRPATSLPPLITKTILLYSATSSCPHLFILSHHLAAQHLDNGVGIVVLGLDLSLQLRQGGAKGENLGVVQRLGRFGRL